MSSQKFRFVSPGIFLDEIDKSQLDRNPAPVGPVVIGRTQRGPGMRPVTVNSFLEFTELFGDTVPGGSTDDVWRKGNNTTPMYATYAARAWLKNGSPLTVVRVLGESEELAVDDDELAGWKVKGPNSAIGENGGAFGLYVGNNEDSGSNPINGTLAAIFYLKEGAIRLTGSGQNGAVITGGAGELVKSSGNGFGFKLVIEDDSGTELTTQPFNFDSTSSKFIRKVFNTNPTLLGAQSYNPNNATYFLGETFERNVNDALGTSSDEGDAVAFIVALNGGNNRLSDAQAATTGMVISQATGGTSSLDTQDLFELKALDTGEWINSNVKVSITDIAAPNNPDADPYGTFTVQVRSARDTDNNPKVLESFTGCNLNPESTNYICAKIGDKISTWNKTSKRFEETGTFNNKSKYIYVQESAQLKAGTLNANLLPFGFKGPQTLVTVETTLSSAAAPDSLWTIDIPDAPANDKILGSGSAQNPLTCSGPSIPLRLSSSDGGITDPTAAYWGITTDKASRAQFDPAYVDLTRMLGAITGSTGGLTQSFTFSLDNLAYAEGTGKTLNVVYYNENNRSTGKAISAGGNLPGATPAPQASASFESVLEQGLNKFTMPMVGGFDGFNSLEKDPLSNTLLETSTAYAFNSVMRAIDTVADPEVVEMNAIAVPGVTNEPLTNHLVEVCEQRADALAILDLKGGYVPAHESASGAEDIGSVDATVRDLKDRSMNSSYACAYYPWVQTKDELGSGRILWVPPSVAALGTFASNDKKSAPWFAPAGFTRGGLSDGAAGIPVIGVREHLTRKMRDKLYENNVNPIAKFPAEGIVIFGQKTMQATPSALDRVNVRRMMIHVKKGISNIASTLLFDQNVQTTWARFLGKAEPFLRDVQAQLGLTDYKIVLDETTTTPDLVDRNIMYAKIFLQPARSIEFIAIDFVIQRTGASFDD